MMDGKGGDVCDYSYVLLSGETLSPASVFIDPTYTLCPESTVVISSDALSPNASLTYQWTTPNGSILSGSNDPSITVDAAGDYSVLVTDDNGCTAMAETEVIAAPPHTSTISTPDLINCVDNTTETLSVFVNPPNGQVYSYQWSTTTGNILSGENSSMPTVDLAGWYYLTVTNDWNCIALDSVEVLADVNTPVSVAATEGELNCITSSVRLNGIGSSTGNDFNYLWSTSAGNILEGETTLSPLVDAPGDYELLVTNLINGCTESSSATVILNDAEPTGADLLVLQPCYGETNGSLFIESVIGGIPTYQYSFDGENFGLDNFQERLEPGDYSIIIRDDTGCEWDTLITITPQPELVLDLGQDQTIGLGCEVPLQALVNYPLPLLDTIIWQPPLDCGGCFDTLISPLNSIEYIAEVIDINGCTVRDTVTFLVQKERGVFIPNAFSPNGDGINDLFMVYGGKEVAQVKSFLVFDRWGELLTAHYNFLPNDNAYSWDGQLKGRDSQIGVFIYAVEVEFLDGYLETYRGSITLHR